MAYDIDDLSDLLNKLNKEFPNSETVKKVIETVNMCEKSIREDRHNFRRPLQSIVGYVDILIEDENELAPQEKKDYLEVIQNCAKSMIYMANNSLDVGAIEAGKYQLRPVEFNLERAVKNSIMLHTPEIKEKNLTIDYQFDETINREEMQKYKGEEVRIEIVFSNLMSNACKAAPNDSKIIISTKQENDYYVFDMHNQGVVSKQIRASFFEPYTTIVGTGLGTYHAKLFVEAHKGTIEMKTSEEEGTNITVKLPRYITF